MNHSYNLAPVAALPAPQEEQNMDVLGLLDTVLNARWLVLGITFIAVLAGSVYAFLSPPVYQADTMVQVEQTANEAGRTVLGELSAVFNVQSSAAAEMEIVRSRRVVGQAADNLQLYVEARPNYLPLVGAWLAQHARGLSTPGLFGLDGYVWGTESIQVGHLDVPEHLENVNLTLTATPDGYELRGPDGQELARGKPGVPSNIQTEKGVGRILINGLNAEPGARFILVRRSRLNMIDALQDRLVITEKGKSSGVLSISLEGTDPARIAQVLNGVGAAYVEQNTERKAAEAEKSLAFLNGFLPQLKQQMDEADNKYTAFRDKHGTFDLGTEGTLSLNASVTMQAQLFDLQQKRRELAVQFGPAHPSIQAIDSQIKAISAQLAALTARIKALPDLEQKLVNLSRDVKINGELYASLLNSTQQLRLIKEGKVGNVRVVDTAAVPQQPIKPNRPLVITIATLLGLALGVGFALMRGMLRRGVKLPNDIEASLGLNVFATVPRVLPRSNRQLRLANPGATKYVLAEIWPDDPAIESLRSLRTALRFALRDAANNVVLLTGPTPNIGKTFTAVNLAAILGSAEKRVLLVDADFRSGHIQQYFGLGREKGLSELIQGTLSAQQAVRKNVMPNVDLLTTGVLPRNPAELLMSSATADLLKALSADYDVVLLDTAPILAVSDAMALAPYVGTVFMLARAQVSTLGEIEESTKRLNHAGAHVKGVIFNDFDPTIHRFSSKYGHHRNDYYAYGASSKP